MFELCDVAATELEQRDSLKVSLQSPYRLLSVGHREVQEERREGEGDATSVPGEHVCLFAGVSHFQIDGT